MESETERESEKRKGGKEREGVRKQRRKRDKMWGINEDIRIKPK